MREKKIIIDNRRIILRWKLPDLVSVEYPVGTPEETISEAVSRIPAVIRQQVEQYWNTWSVPCVPS